MAQETIEIKDNQGLAQQIRATKDNLGNKSFVQISESMPIACAMGRMSGYNFIDKFGENPDIDTGSTPEDITEIGGLYVWDDWGTAPIVSVISDNAADTQPLTVSGLDINGDLVTQTVTLSGTNRVSLTTPLWRCNRASNSGTVSFVGSIFVYTGTGGVPTTGLQRAKIVNGNNQTLMAVYTIPRGKVGYLFRGELGASRSNTSGEIRCAYYSRRFQKVFRIKKRVNLSNSGSSIYQDSRSQPDIIPALTDIRLTVEESSANNMGVFGTFDIMLVDEELLDPAYLTEIEQPTV